MEEPSSCLITTYNASNSPLCCGVAKENIFSQLSNQSEPNNVCNLSIYPPYPFKVPEELIPISGNETLSAGVYVVPSFNFSCRGCVDEVLVQALIPNYVHPDPITVSMSFTIWSRFVDDQGEALYTLRDSVTETVNEDNITPEIALREQLAFNFSLPEDNVLCFNENEVFGLSFGSTHELQVILAPSDSSSGSTYSVSPEDGTCPELNEFRGATLVEDDERENRIPFMAIRISKSSMGT